MELVDLCVCVCVGEGGRTDVCVHRGSTDKTDLGVCVCA